MLLHQCPQRHPRSADQLEQQSTPRGLAVEPLPAAYPRYEQRSVRASNVVARHVPDPSSVSHATSASGSYPDWNSMGGTLLSAVSPVSSEISSRNPIPSDDASNVSDHDAVNPRQMPSPPTVMRPRGPSGLSGSELPRLVASAAASSSSTSSSSDASSASDAPLGVLVHADAVRPKATACAFPLNREAHLYPGESGNVDGSSVIVSSPRTSRPSTRWHRRMHRWRRPSIVKRSRVWALRREIIHKVRPAPGEPGLAGFEVRLPNRGLPPPRITEGLARSGVDGVRDVHLDLGHAAGEARRCGPARWVRRWVRPRRAQPRLGPPSRDFFTSDFHVKTALTIGTLSSRSDRIRARSTAGSTSVSSSRTRQRQW